MMMILRILLLFALGIGIGLLMAELDIELNPVYLFLGIVIVGFPITYAFLYYQIQYSKNPKTVERFIQRNRRHPYYAFLHHYLEGDLARAEESIRKLHGGGRKEQMRANGLSAIYLHEKRFADAKKEAEKLNMPEARHYTLALIALLSGDWDEYHQIRSQLKTYSYNLILDAEEAFQRGDMTKAKELGDRAIAETAGITRYLLIKGLERSQNNPDRFTYF